MNGMRSGNRAGDRRHLDSVTVVTNSHGGFFVPVNAGDVFQKPMHKVNAELLAVGDDVDPRFGLMFQLFSGRALLCAFEIFTL
jgi:hypothetical protein